VRTALIGFLTGVGVQVGAAMLCEMVGVAVASRRTLVQFWQVFEGLPSLNPNRLGLSLFVVASILLGKKFAPKFPVSLIVVGGAIAASAWLNRSEHGFSVIGPVQGGLPSLRLPQVTWSESSPFCPSHYRAS
jgi:sulfate permease, SulP family